MAASVSLEAEYVAQTFGVDNCADIQNAWRVSGISGRQFAYKIGVDMDAENTYQVFDWLWSSGQLSECDILKLASQGIEVVINLAPPTSSNALSGEAELVTRQGLAYIQIPVEWERPDPEQFAQFVGVMSAFAGRKVWVHCAKNMRVSAYIYLYRMLILHESEEDATYPMREIWSPNETWRGFIAQVNRSRPELPAKA